MERWQLAALRKEHMIAFLGLMALYAGETRSGGVSRVQSVLILMGAVIHHTLAGAYVCFGAFAITLGLCAPLSGDNGPNESDVANGFGLILDPLLH